VVTAQQKKKGPSGQNGKKRKNLTCTKSGERKKFSSQKEALTGKGPTEERKHPTGRKRGRERGFSVHKTKTRQGPRKADRSKKKKNKQTYPKKKKEEGETGITKENQIRTSDQQGERNRKRGRETILVLEGGGKKGPKRPTKKEHENREGQCGENSRAGSRKVNQGRDIHPERPQTRKKRKKVMYASREKENRTQRMLSWWA